MTIGVFDSGIGGEAVAAALAAEFPEAKIITVNDSSNVPYGGRKASEVLKLTDAALQPLLKAKVDILVIACNTATTLALPTIRKRYPAQLFIGIEPMIKPASLATKTGIVVVCATPATLKSRRYAYLRESYGSNLTIIEPDCSDWAYLIEQNELSMSKIKTTIEPVLQQGSDVIVLGCTHYIWIKLLIQNIVKNKAIILEPSESIAKQVKRLFYRTGCDPVL